LFNILTQHWWLWALRGMVAILFGIGVFVWPAVGLVVLVALFGAFALVDGIFALIGAVQINQWHPLSWALLIEGLIGIAAGLVTFIWPGITAVALLFIIAFWAILTGILELVATFRFRSELGSADAWLVGLGGVASLVFGVLLVARPGVGALAVIWLIGIYAVIFGIAMLLFGFRLRSFQAATGLEGRGGSRVA